MVVEPVEFLVGPVSRGAAAALAGLTGAYAVLTGLYAARGFRARLQDRWSAACATLIMAALAVLLWHDGAAWLPAPFSIWLLVIAVGGIVFTLTFTLGHYQERIDRFQQQFGKRLQDLLADLLPEDRYDEWQRLRAQWQLDPEQRRKAPHLLMGTFLLVYGALGHLVLLGIWTLSYGGNPFGPDVGEGIQNLDAAAHAPWLAGGQILGSFGLLGLLYLLLPNELLRLKFPELSYPFKSVIVSRLRPREQGLFGAHFYITATTALVALLLTRDPVVWDTSIYAVGAAIAVAVFADAASALVGTRFGRRKWFHNPGKSYAGSIGGVVVAFVVALPLVGLPLAVLSAAAFLLMDVLAPVPFFVSDNILNPMALAIVYLALRGDVAPLLPYY